MNRKQLLRPGLNLVLATITLGVACGTEVPQKGERGDTSNSQKVDVVPATTRDAPTVEKSGIKHGDRGGKVMPNGPDVPSADEQAIRLTGNAYVKAFASADTKAIAALFAPDAEYVDELGNVHRGRQSIMEYLGDCFASNPGASMDLAIESIRFVGSGVAIEDGTTTLRAADSSAEPIDSRYSAVHIKIDGQWLTASLREQAPKERRQHRLQLRQLDWLQGDWVDEADESVVNFSCTAIDHGHFLLRKFTIQIAGQEAMSGTQRIGWDPLTGKLKSWIFDTEGGYN